MPTLLRIGPADEGRPLTLEEFTTASFQEGYKYELIDGWAEIDPAWLKPDDTVLITAGASAPEEVVQEVVAYLERRHGAKAESRTVREEHVHFPLPRELRVVAV